MAIKGYVVRGKRGSDGAEIAAWTHDGGIGSPVSAVQFRTPGQACGAADALTYRGCTDVAIFRVHPDGHEERLPSYEEALAELVRLRDQHIADRAEMAGAMAEMKECARALDGVIEAHAKKDAEIERLRAVEALNVGAIDASLVRLGAVTGAIGPMPQRERHDARCMIHDGAGCSFEAGCDAGRALMPVTDPLAALEAAERRLLESARWTPGDRGFWIDPDDGTQWPREGAISDVRRRLAAKGGA